MDREEAREHVAAFRKRVEDGPAFSLENADYMAHILDSLDRIEKRFGGDLCNLLSRVANIEKRLDGELAEVRQALGEGK